MFNFHTFELKDIIALLQKYNLEIQKPGYTLYGKYKGVTLFEGTVSGRADDKILNILMPYDLETYNDEIRCINNYYPITLETIESKLKSLVEGYKLLEVALKKKAIEKDFK
jgi:hypothetical protein